MSLLFQFIHIPKCAGTSTWRLLQEVTGDKENYEPKHLVFKKRKRIAGQTVKTFTVVRDPVERVISTYKFVTGRMGHRIIREHPDLYKATIYHFCKRMVETKNPEFHNMMTKCISGNRDDGVTWKDAMRRVAKGAFDFIGFVQQFQITVDWILDTAKASGLEVDTTKFGSLSLNKSEKVGIHTQAGYQKAIELIVDANREDIVLYSVLREAYYISK